MFIELYCDKLQALFWVLAYIFIIIYHVKYKSFAIPLTALILNLSWEFSMVINDILINSLFSYTNVIHISWLFLDFIILFTYLRYSKNQYIKAEFTILICLFLCGLTMLILTNNNKLFLNYSFIIDLIMCILYFIFCFKKIFQENIILICIFIFKLLGDLCAALFYFRFNDMIKVIGTIVFVLNIISTIVLIYRYIKRRIKS